MDRSSYRVSMLLETLVLSSLVATLPLTQRYSPSLGWAGFAVWVWAIYFTFPGTYSTQPAVTTQEGSRAENEPSRRRPRNFSTTKIIKDGHSSTSKYSRPRHHMPHSFSE